MGISEFQATFSTRTYFLLGVLQILVHLRYHLVYVLIDPFLPHAKLLLLLGNPLLKHGFLLLASR